MTSAARFDAGIDAQALALRKLQRQQLAGRRQKAALGIFGIKPRLDGVAVERHLRLASSGSFSPAAMRNCHSTRSRPVTASVTGCSTCSRVFISMNQKPSCFQPARAVGDELDRAGALIADGLGGGDRGLAHRGAQRRAHAGRRRFLDHFLVAALQRAVALVEMDGVAVAVGEDLHLDMARRVDVFLDQHALVAEGRFRLALRRGERRRRNRRGGRPGACPCRRRRPPP